MSFVHQVERHKILRRPALNVGIPVQNDACLLTTRWGAIKPKFQSVEQELHPLKPFVAFTTNLWAALQKSNPGAVYGVGWCRLRILGLYAEQPYNSRKFA